MAGICGDVCGDNRFEIIARAKQSILEGTNIDTSPDEMKVLDNFLFRCWQMDWLDCYDENKKLVEQKKGQWNILTDEYDCEYMKCSVCSEEFYPVDEDTVDRVYNYCPHCGAKMEEE